MRCVVRDELGDKIIAVCARGNRTMCPMCVKIRDIPESRQFKTRDSTAANLMAPARIGTIIYVHSVVVILASR